MTKKGVPADAFKEQKTITSINFGNYCTYIGDSAFIKCINIENFNTDNVIEEIGSYAFKDCENLKSIVFNKCINIGERAFENCENLKRIRFNILKNINKYTFNNCINLNTISLSKCEKIEEGAFKKCESLDSIKLNKCETIGTSAFEGCSSLSIVTLPVCKKIYSNAFVNCENLKKIYINSPSIFCEIEGRPFDSNTLIYFTLDMIKNYYINNDNWITNYANNIVPIIDDNKIIIYKTNDNESIDINTNNKNIKSYYFKPIKCGVIDFDYIVEYIGQIFKGEKTLTYVGLPQKCERIIESAFDGCENLQHIEISNTLQMIGDYAFKDCKSLTSFEIPETVEILEEGIFGGCENMEKIEGKFVTYNNNAIVFNNILICVLPKSVNKNHVISEIDKNIKRLGKYCFYGCKEMTSVHIPSNILSIGNYAFKDCEQLKDVYIYGYPPILGLGVFKNVNEDFKIYVQKDLVSLYKLVYEDEGCADKIYPMS